MALVIDNSVEMASITLGGEPVDTGKLINGKTLHVSLNTLHNVKLVTPL